ncbi:hypothetical protein [Profundibacter sp.]
MALDCDPDAVQALVDQLKPLRAEERLHVLERAVMDHGGIWDMPAKMPDVYQPVLMFVQVFGITAFAETAEELAINWMRVAEGVLT